MKLNFELVPDSCWCSNLRTMFPQAWEGIRKKAYAKAKGRCMICGVPTVRLEAHEQWAYDEEACVQKLVNIVAICKSCHEVIHIGRTTLMGREREASEHFMKVNNCSYAQYRKALGEANSDHKRRNRIAEWGLDVTFVKTFLEAE